MLAFIPNTAGSGRSSRRGLLDAAVARRSWPSGRAPTLGGDHSSRLRGVRRKDDNHDEYHDHNYPTRPVRPGLIPAVWGNVCWWARVRGIRVVRPPDEQI